MKLSYLAWRHWKLLPPSCRLNFLTHCTSLEPFKNDICTFPPLSVRDNICHNPYSLFEQLVRQCSRCLHDLRNKLYCERHRLMRFIRYIENVLQSLAKPLHFDEAETRASYTIFNFPSSQGPQHYRDRHQNSTGTIKLLSSGSPRQFWHAAEIATRYYRKLKLRFAYKWTFLNVHFMHIVAEHGACDSRTHVTQANCLVSRISHRSGLWEDESPLSSILGAKFGSAPDVSWICAWLSGRPCIKSSKPYARLCVCVCCGLWWLLSTYIFGESIF